METLRWGGAEGGCKISMEITMVFFLVAWQFSAPKLAGLPFLVLQDRQWLPSWIPTNEAKLFLPPHHDSPLSQAVEYFIKKCFDELGLEKYKVM